jgi:4-hydroxy-3-methylbut-2-enyl diphosphate reductase
MKIRRALAYGMCFGVRDAINLAVHEAEKAPLTVFGELVHNEAVLSSLRQRGVQFESDAARVATTEVMITAHGASERTRAKLKEHGLQVVEATCPLVHHAHRTLQRLVREGCHPVVIGKRGHVEVRGLTEDLPACDIVLSEADVAALSEHPRFGVVAQTTQPLERVDHLLGLIRQRFPNSEVWFRDTVCQPTKQRQMAAVDLARQSDVVIVIGGMNSNNTRELVETCSRFCPRVYHVQNSGGLREEWFDGVTEVGITAGTSTPDVIIDSVEHRIQQLAAARADQLHPAQKGAPARELALPFDHEPARANRQKAVAA